MMLCLIHAGIVAGIHFHFSPNEGIVSINVSLSCNSSGRPVETVVWTRDGLLLEDTGPLYLMDTFAFSYTSILEVRGRAQGTYTCHMIGSNNQVLSSASFTVEGITVHIAI